MAKQIAVTYLRKPKVRRPNVHAKTKMSRSKNATNYKKPYKGQGK